VTDRAYCLLTVKSIDVDRREIRGVATTPDTDRLGDIIEPLGVSFTNPLPLLLHHDAKQPVGTVNFDPPTASGITFTASLPHIEEPGRVKDRVDEAWHSLKAGLIRGASIGFRAMPDWVKPLKGGGLHFLKTLVAELSLVTVPANSAATITSVKAFDVAAPGPNAPGPSGIPLPQRGQKAAHAMTTVEQITAFESKRAASLAAAQEIQKKVLDEGRSKDDTEREKYDELTNEVKACDLELKDLRDMEKMQILTATPITTTANPVQASALRGGESSTTPVIQVRSMLPKGTAFTRMCMAIASSGGDSYKAIERAKGWHDSTPEVELMVRAAVAVGTSTDSTWAGPLVVTQPLVDEFLDLLRPKTLLGRVPGLKQVPFNISIPSQTTGGTYGWVGQNKPKPVTKADYATVTLGFNKAAGIIVLSEELVRLSTPSAEGLVRNEMIQGMGAFLDIQFVDPTVAVSVGVNPASITNGAATIASSGVTSAAAKVDLSSRVNVFVTANYSLGESVWLMNESNAFGLGLSVNALGQPLFPGFTGESGQRLMGIPVVISNNVGLRIILLHAPSILYADEGGVRIDVSREASVQMDSAPTDTVDATTVYLSLWQRNLVGLKAERFITWVRARSTAVTYVTTASPYNGT
jgi:HK97 family phage major capsid protein/HK97 family phage prohead protease